MTKFDTVELLKGKLYTPVPKFFFRLMFQYYPYLPPSFWVTLLFILDTTLGGSLTGIEGYLAQSQIPVVKNESAKWIAAMAGYGRLLEVDYSDGSNFKGSKFRLKPQATEEDWLDFIEELCVAHEDRAFARYLTENGQVVVGESGKRVPNTPDRIRKAFARYRNIEMPSSPLWYTRYLGYVADENCPWYKWAREIDVWDDKNWVQRGFDKRWMFDLATLKVQVSGEWIRPPRLVKEFAGFSHFQDADLLFFFEQILYFAWINSDETDEAPGYPSGRIPKLLASFRKNWHSDLSDAAVSRVLERFKTATHPSGSVLQNDWLTRHWKRFKVLSPSEHWQPNRVALSNVA